jgi:hypothetical protein
MSERGTLDRPAWVADTVGRLQICVGDLFLCEVDEIHPVLRDLAAGLTPWQSPSERVFLRNQLYEFARRTAFSLHASVHPRTNARCDLDVHEPLQSFWTESLADPRAGFLNWADRYCEALARVHPVPIAVQLSRRLRRDHRDPVSRPKLARSYHVTPATLSHLFHQRFGMSIRVPDAGTPVRGLRHDPKRQD